MSSSNERWLRVKALFHAALEKPSADRRAFLTLECSDDDSVREDVERLLQAHDGAGTFIDAPAVSLLAPDYTTEPPDGLTRVGAYEIVRKLGEGGMGTVFLALRADDIYRRQVALKVVKRGMDTDEVVERFRRERELLATLDHPNIARVVDGGATSDGRPYFVMDYVEGSPIDQYCEEKGLDLTARLHLYREVCGGVEYAHRNLVVHRDLKPDNILVTPEGVPKLLDFGIAKLLDPAHPGDIDLTRAHGPLMTPAYASPEQVRRQPISTATDVYSLGVLLYRLLTGVPPYMLDGLDAAEIERAICEQEPPPPSVVAVAPGETAAADGAGGGRDRSLPTVRLRRRLAGDLDTIVLTALHKEPQRRYASVERLSNDVRRYLEGLPITARPATLRYRARKFVRRNRAAVASAALIFISLLGGILVAGWQARVADQHRVEAEQRFEQVRRLANTFVFEIHDAVEKLPGSTPVRELMVKRGLEYLDSLAARADDNPALQEELASAYTKIGEVQGHPQYSNLGRPTDALNSYRKALALRTRIASDSTQRHELARTHRVVGDLLEITGDTRGAVAHYRASIQALERLVAADKEGRKFTRDLAIAYSSLADRLGNPAFQHLGDPKMAEGLYRRALAMFEQIAREEPNELRSSRNVGLVWQRLAQMVGTGGDFRLAEEYEGRAMAIFERVQHDPRATTQNRRDLSNSLSHYAEYLVEQGRAVEGLKYHERAFELSTKLLAEDPANTLFRDDVAVANSRLGALLAHPDHTAVPNVPRGLEHYQQAIHLFRETFTQDPNSAAARRNLYATIQELGDVLWSARSHREALAAYETAVAGMLPWGSTPGADPSARGHLAWAHARLARALLTSGSTAQAREQYAKAWTLWKPLIEAKQVPTDALRFVAETYEGLGDVELAAAGSRRSPEACREARDWYARAQDVLHDLDRRGLLIGPRRKRLENVSAAVARCEAVVAARGGLAFLDRAPPDR